MDDIVYRANELFIFRSAADGGAERSGCVELGTSDVTTWGQIVCGMQTRIYAMLEEEICYHHHQFICSKIVNGIVSEWVSSFLTAHQHIIG